MLGIKKRDTKQVFKAIAHQQGVSVSEEIGRASCRDRVFGYV